MQQMTIIMRFSLLSLGAIKKWFRLQFTATRNLKSIGKITIKWVSQLARNGGFFTLRHGPKFLIQKTFEMGTSEVRFYEWWSMLQEAWLRASLDISRQLKEIFHAHDENKDGVLDFDEFHKMIASFLNEEQLRLQGCDAGRLFSLCLEETSDLAKRSNIEVEDDIILPQAFVNVARMKRLDRHLVCPYPTPCCHAEYPDPCESP